MKLKKRILGAIEFLMAVLLIVLFCRFIYAHSGIEYVPCVVSEVATYEFVTQTSADNNRIKELVPVKVVYRYVERR